MQASAFSYHDVHTNYTKTIQNQKSFQNQNFNSHELCIHIITLYKMKVFLKVTNTSLYTNQKETNQETYPPHGSPNNQKETSHGSPCDSTINHKETTSHGSPCDFTINHKQTTSHGSLCDSTINHKQTTSHGAHDISQCTMIKLWNRIPNLSH
jgi:hypothetical protein